MTCTRCTTTGALFYAMGAGDVVLDKALDGWNAVTRYNDDGIVHRAKHGEFHHGAALRTYSPQLRREFFNKATMSGAGSSEWHHIGEACVAFYHFGLADPTISENVRRARAFAAMFMGEDPLAPNFDPEQGIFRSPIQTSEGPYVDGSVDKAVWWLQGAMNGKPQGPMTATGRRATLYPVVEYLEDDWFDDPKRRDETVRLFENIVLRGDTPQSLAAAGLITNAYLYTGDEKYRKWGSGLRRAMAEQDARERRDNARQHRPDRQDRRTPRRPMVGRSLRLERERLFQHLQLADCGGGVRFAALGRPRVSGSSKVPG